ncbi:MAG: DUF5668 domain-containing protein [Anaerolineales bacterium]|nr:DUF5668 domain-containing protein [Anaerolineales bacterium]
MKEEKGYHRQKSYFGPLLLIFLGAIFLIHNLGILPGSGWSSLLQLWPVLLIAAGLDDLLRRQGVVWPVMLIGAGTFLLLNNLGPATWISWTKLFQLWPVILIALGIDLIFRANTGWSSALGVVLTVVLIGGMVWWIGVQGLEANAGTREVSQVIGEEIEAADITLDLAAGQLVLGDLSDPGHLIGGEISPDQAEENYTEIGDRAVYTLQSGKVSFYPWTADWKLGVSRAVPVGLEIKNGAGQLFLALDGIKMEELAVSQGAGEIVLRLSPRVPIKSTWIRLWAKRWWSFPGKWKSESKQNGLCPTWSCRQILNVRERPMSHPIMKKGMI